MIVQPSYRIVTVGLVVCFCILEGTVDISVAMYPRLGPPTLHQKPRISGA